MADPSYKTYKYTLEPKEVLTVTRTASFVSCLASSFPFKMSMNDGAENDFEAGITFSQVDDFSRLQIHNPSSTEELVVALALGRGEITDSRLTLGGEIKVDVQNDELPVRVLNNELRVRVVNPTSSNVSVSGTASVAVQGEVQTRENVPDEFQTNNPTTFNSNARGLLVGQNDDRREVIVTNDGAKRVYICGTNSATLGHGMPLEGGQSVTLQTTASIYVRNDEDIAAKVHFCELGWS